MGQSEKSGLWLLGIVLLVANAYGELNLAAKQDRCRDDSFCRAYCLSTNPDTVTARCGTDLASCICMNPNNLAVKVRFLEERNPVPSTLPTTPRPTESFVNSQPLANSNYQQHLHYGHQNSVAAQPQPQPEQPSEPVPVLLECDNSEQSTKMCHLFCIMEIQAWYGLCNTTSKACACYGVPLSAVQDEPIAAIFHSSASMIATPAPPTTPSPYTSYMAPVAVPAQPLQYSQYQPLSQYQQQQWTPVQPSHQTFSPNGFYLQPSQPTVLSPAAHSNQLHIQEQSHPHQHGHTPLVTSFTTSEQTSSIPVSFASSVSVSSDNSEPEIPVDGKNAEGAVTSAAVPVPVEAHPSSPLPRRRRALNNLGTKGDESPASNKDLALMGDCTKFKCALDCKRNNLFSPDCTPKCREGECVCECIPR